MAWSISGFRMNHFHTFSVSRFSALSSVMPTSILNQVRGDPTGIGVERIGEPVSRPDLVAMVLFHPEFPFWRQLSVSLSQVAKC